ncbi:MULTISPECIES: hypothetical protein [Kordiimonas]|uniref:hypothetical protein n=1 Tax=Kordiimonas TaxID=288021 RepID=UPI002580C586|nr:hypothetical protein [Kordiimonas sp. UBA4487]
MRFITIIALTITAVSSAAFGCANFLFSDLKDQCGKAFEGRVVEDSTNDPRWGNARLVMHIRDCSDTQLKIPLHMDDDRSRVWVITKLPDGHMQLKHDHRHADGSEDKVTQYGGRTRTIASASSFDFPVDDASIENFMENGLEASVTNVWQLRVEQAQNTFHYRLERPGRSFEIVFDLTKPVPVPPPAWDLR